MTRRPRADRSVRLFLAGLSLIAGLVGETVGCGSGDDNSVAAPALIADAGSSADADASAALPVPEAAAAEEASVEDATTGDVAEGGGGEAGAPVAVLSAGPIAFGSVNCSASKTQTFALGNTGTGPLAISATTTGSAFSVTPTSLSVAPGAADAGLTVTAAIPGSSTAGSVLSGSLNLFTNDPAHPSVIVNLSATAMGATLTFAPTSPTSATFASTESGFAAQPVALSLQNIGNAPATVSFGAPTDAQFSLSSAADGGSGTTLSAGATLDASAGFTPAVTTLASATATSTVTVAGVTCGTNVSSISYTGTVGYGSISGWPGTVDFGPSDCGGSPPMYQTFTLMNYGTVGATITSATISGAPGFTVIAQGGVIPAESNGVPGSYGVTLHAPAVPLNSPTTPITATLTIQTDADATPHTVTLQEEPNGAALTFDTTDPPAPANFGSFGPIVLLQAASQSFAVKNTGTAATNVTLSVVSSSDAGTPAFTLSNTSFSLPAVGTQTDSVVFSPTAPSNTGSISITATGPLCQPLPPPIALTGNGIGGGPSVSPTSLSFMATCGAAAPQPQAFTVSNLGQANMNWDMSAVTGPGAAQYTVSSSPPPGVLAPGATATVIVTAAAVPSPAPNPTPSAYAASLTITTDVPFDDDHVVSLGETPLGDQLSLSVSNMRFGQFPINTTTVPQNFVVTNNANAGSPAANVSFALAGTKAGAYAIAPTAQSNIAPAGGVSGPEGVTFDPSSADMFPAAVTLTTSDALCTALPSGVRLNGTGTQGKVLVSTNTIAFGTDANDPKGLVNCGATGLAHTFTVSNSGNAAFQITGLSLGLGTNSPYALSGDTSTLPATVAIGRTANITVTPNAIPGAVADPNDGSPFMDTLTVTTNAALDSPHTVSLVMQARGAVISDTSLTTTWNFGTVGSGTIGTFTSTITNTGNAAASIAFGGLKQPTIFGLQNNPTTVAPNAVTSVVGQFSPPSASGQWADQGTLVVTPAQVFCEPLPTTWVSPAISVSGASNGNPPVTLSGALTFPTTSCGSAPPAGQAITITNNTNQALTFSTTFNSGAFYTVHASVGDAGGGTIPASGVATVIVTPKTVTPGPTVSAGSAPYADDLLITIQSSPATTFTIPISWTLDGAVLSLPQGGGSNHDAVGNPFYAADTESGLTLPMDNTGTATATVTFGSQPTTAFTFSPAPPISVQPGIEALPRLTSTSSDATCPALTSGSVTFLYSGPVCRPFQLPQVTIQSCVGTY
jgi:hypothetical protein